MSILSRPLEQHALMRVMFRKLTEPTAWAGKNGTKFMQKKQPKFADVEPRDRLKLRDGRVVTVEDVFDDQIKVTAEGQTFYIRRGEIAGHYIHNNSAYDRN